MRKIKSKTWISDECDSENHDDCPFEEKSYRMKYSETRCNCTCHKARTKKQTQSEPTTTLGEKLTFERRHRDVQKKSIARYFLGDR